MAEINHKLITAFAVQIAEICKYKCWDSEVGDKKAQELINEVHRGKFGGSEGIWVQWDKVLRGEKLTNNWSVAREINALQQQLDAMHIPVFGSEQAKFLEAGAWKDTNPINGK